MSDTFRETTFKHLNDCRQLGCPGHTMRVVFHGTSDTVSMSIDGEEYFVLDEDAFETMVELAAMSRKEYDILRIQK